MIRRYRAKNIRSNLAIEYFLLYHHRQFRCFCIYTGYIAFDVQVGKQRPHNGLAIIQGTTEPFLSGSTPSDGSFPCPCRTQLTCWENRTELSQLSKCTTGVAVFVPHVFLVETFEVWSISFHYPRWQLALGAFGPTLRDLLNEVLGRRLYRFSREYYLACLWNSTCPCLTISPMTTALLKNINDIVANTFDQRGIVFTLHALFSSSTCITPQVV